jgi:cell division protein FtsL
MIKLLLCLVTGLVIAVCLLQMRQQRLELNHQANQLHSAIEAQQAKLWSQQLQVAIYTAPNSIQKTVGDHNLQLAPQNPNGVGPSNWINSQSDPAQE